MPKKSKLDKILEEIERLRKEVEELRKENKELKKKLRERTSKKPKKAKRGEQPSKRGGRKKDYEKEIDEYLRHGKIVVIAYAKGKPINVKAFSSSKEADEWQAHVKKVWKKRAEKRTSSKVIEKLASPETHLKHAYYVVYKCYEEECYGSGDNPNNQCDGQIKNTIDPVESVDGVMRNLYERYIEKGDCMVTIMEGKKTVPLEKVVKWMKKYHMLPKIIEWVETHYFYLEVNPEESEPE